MNDELAGRVQSFRAVFAGGRHKMIKYVINRYRNEKKTFCNMFFFSRFPRLFVSFFAWILDGVMDDGCQIRLWHLGSLGLSFDDDLAFGCDSQCLKASWIARGCPVKDFLCSQIHSLDTWEWQERLVSNVYEQVSTYTYKKLNHF